VVSYQRPSGRQRTVSPCGRPQVWQRRPARSNRTCRLICGQSQSAWIIGAVCPARDTGVALVLTRLDTAAMNLFLAELSQAVAAGAHGIVLMDKAGWHTAGDLVVPKNLSLVFLPPYSPELNPIERLWLHLRDNRLTHRVFRTTEDIIDGCCNAWNWLLGETGRIRSLCSYPWLAQTRI
jgi:transposase